jgi:hypothetical protein
MTGDYDESVLFTESVGPFQKPFPHLKRSTRSLCHPVGWFFGPYSRLQLRTGAKVCLFLLKLD